MDVQQMTRSELISRVGELEAKVALMQDVNEPASLLFLQEAFDLTLKEAEYLHLMADGRPRTKRQIMMGVYPDRLTDLPEIKIVDVYLCKIRKKVNPFGVEFETIWGSGYHLSIGREIVQDAIAGVMPKQVSRSPSRPVTPHLVHDRRGTEAQKMLAELIRRCDVDGLVEFEAREFAAAIQMKRNILYVIEYLEQRGLITIINRASKQAQAVRRWTVKLAPHVFEGRR